MADYAFRAATGNDLTMLSGWLGQLQVARWWPDPARQLALIREDLGDPAMTQLIVSHGGDPIAYVQHYPARKWAAPQFAHLPHDTIALDLFAGPQGFGHGGRYLRQLGDDLLTRAQMLAIDPLPANTTATRAFRSAGFEGNVIRPDSDGKSVLVMTRRR
ncbi:MAG: GNAT family N-acetyltransferase [Paracoccus sp. (in: a-proteobacteria)]|nr:GNAT family N-acetyltransferase [Paracoccus sp. (in: a-proteobacteria)]